MAQMSRANSLFSPKTSEFVAIMLLAVTLATCFYVGVITIIEKELRSTYRAVNIFDQIFAHEALAPLEMKDLLSASQSNSRVMHLGLLRMGLLSEFDNPPTWGELKKAGDAKGDKFEYKSLFRLIEPTRSDQKVPRMAPLGSDEADTGERGSTLELVAYLMQYGRDGPHNAQGKSGTETTLMWADEIAKSLAAEKSEAFQIGAPSGHEGPGLSWLSTLPIVFLILTLIAAVYFTWDTKRTANQVTACRQKWDRRNTHLLALIVFALAGLVVSFLPWKPWSMWHPTPLPRGDEIFRVLKDKATWDSPQRQTTPAATQTGPGGDGGPALTRLPLLRESTDPLTGEELNQMTLATVVVRLLDQTHADAAVKRWISYMNLIRGPEQFGIIVLFAGATLLLLDRKRRVKIYRCELGDFAVPEDNLVYAAARDDWANPMLDRTFPLNRQMTDIEKVDVQAARLKYKDQSEPSLLRIFAWIARKELDAAIAGKKQPTRDALRNERDRVLRAERRSRWLIRWMAFAMPAVDFIGCVRGISAGLGTADNIVREASRIGQAAAITDVTGRLGLSFATTVVALSLLLVVSFVDAKFAAEETAVIEEAYDKVAPLLGA